MLRDVQEVTTSLGVALWTEAEKQLANLSEGEQEKVKDMFEALQAAVSAKAEEIAKEDEDAELKAIAEAIAKKGGISAKKPKVEVYNAFAIGGELSKIEDTLFKSSFPVKAQLRRNLHTFAKTYLNVQFSLIQLLNDVGYGTTAEIVSCAIWILRQYECQCITGNAVKEAPNKPKFGELKLWMLYCQLAADVYNGAGMETIRDFVSTHDYLLNMGKSVCGGWKKAVVREERKLIERKRRAHGG